MRWRRGTALLLVLLLTWFGILYSRAVLPQGEPPALFMAEPSGATVLLGPGFSSSGVHQFFDGITPRSVIELTGLQLDPQWPADDDLDRPLTSGEALDVVLESGYVVEINRFHMPASQRMTLGIPLHPDRMTFEDWQALPGIGVHLAETIMQDRQKNGDFKRLAALSRVRGIGLTRIQNWERYFQ